MDAGALTGGGFALCAGGAPGYCAGRSPGLGLGWRRGRGRGFGGYASVNVQPAETSQKDLLTTQKQALENRLGLVNKQLESL